uniref:4-alpha-glucanotransferase n=2 Tax=Auxenochlorella protothecoides TaxID=3075 RepID=A0A1D2ABW5_AUXPR
MRAMPTTIASTPAPFLRIWSPRSRPSLAFVSHRRISTRVASPIGPDLSPEAVTPASHPDPFPTLAKGAPLPEGYGEPPSAPPKHRRSGIILHPTSLPGPYGIGEIGEEAFRFVDWLVASGQQIWQLLPLCPPETEYWSPYSGLDALCGNPLLIPLNGLKDLGLLKETDLPVPSPPGDADFPAVYAAKMPLLEKAAAVLLADPARFADLHTEMAAFRQENAWVEQSALFSALTEVPGLAGLAWWDWPEGVRDRHPAALEAARREHAGRIDAFIALQYLFDRFWKAVKAYANDRGVLLIGDMPIYVGGQSADVWANRTLFALGPDGAPVEVSGVPPDAFSDSGQLWGSPLYDWQAHSEDRYRWWVQRFQRSLQLYDETRVDHFRAFAGYWAVGAQEETAMNGVWKKGPGIELFEALEAALGHVPILAEDLGVITPDVTALREAIGAPGMVVLQFAWGGGATNTHLPHNIYQNSFVYPGTHDNQTVLGWYKAGCRPEEARLIARYIGAEAGQDISWAFIREAFKSVARTVVVAMQDVMRLDDSARMNTPGKAAGNWAWRVGGSSIWDELRAESADLLAITQMYDRLLLDWKAPGTKDAGTPEAESVSEVETVAEAAAA